MGNVLLFHVLPGLREAGWIQSWSDMCFFPLSSDDCVILIICILAFDGQQQLVLLANRSNSTRPNIYFYSSDYRQGWQRRTADGWPAKWWEPPWIAQRDNVNANVNVAAYCGIVYTTVYRRYTIVSAIQQGIRKATGGTPKMMSSTHSHCGR